MWKKPIASRNYLALRWGSTNWLVCPDDFSSSCNWNRIIYLKSSHSWLTDGSGTKSWPVWASVWSASRVAPFRAHSDTSANGTVAPTRTSALSWTAPSASASSSSQFRRLLRRSLRPSHQLFLRRLPPWSHFYHPYSLQQIHSRRSCHFQDVGTDQSVGEYTSDLKEKSVLRSISFTTHRRFHWMQSMTGHILHKSTDRRQMTVLSGSLETRESLIQRLIA